MLVPCKIALLTVETEYKITAIEPTCIRLTASILVPNNKLIIGFAKTARPTAAGALTNIANLIATAILEFTLTLSPPALALLSSGIKELDKEFAIATGTFINIKYLLVYIPYSFAVSAASPKNAILCPKIAPSIMLFIL